MYFIGQEVECLDPTWGSPTGSQHQLRFCPNLPIKGKIYHIRTCEPATSQNIAVNIEAGCWIRLVEIVNPIIEYVHLNEPIFMGKKYRPVWRKEHEQDISMFTDMLKGVKIREDA